MNAHICVGWHRCGRGKGGLVIFPGSCEDSRGEESLSTEPKDGEGSSLGNTTSALVQL